MLPAKELKILGSLHQKKYREKEGRFLIEGFHLIEECLNSSFYLEKIIVRADINESRFDKIKREYKSKIHEIAEAAPAQFNKISGTENPQGIIGVVKIPSEKQSAEATSGNLILALDRINDPGNLGTIIRTAYWFGTDRILIGKNSADIYNPKVVRSSQGGLFHIEIICNQLLNEELNKYRHMNYGIYLFTPDANENLDEISKPGKSVLVIGNEADGISTDLMNGNFRTVKIKGFSNCESLNAAVSAAIGLFHFKNHIMV